MTSDDRTRPDGEPRKPFKLDVSKEWCEKMAKLEEGYEVGAGNWPTPQSASAPSAGLVERLEKAMTEPGDAVQMNKTSLRSLLDTIAVLNQRNTELCSNHNALLADGSRWQTRAEKAESDLTACQRERDLLIAAIWPNGTHHEIKAVVALAEAHRQDSFDVDELRAEVETLRRARTEPRKEEP